MIDERELGLLRASQDHGASLIVTVNSCAYSCCGRGWHRRDGYWQTYRGRIDNLKESEPGTFMLYSQGLGTIGYVIAARFYEVEDVCWPE